MDIIARPALSHHPATVAPTSGARVVWSADYDHSGDPLEH